MSRNTAPFDAHLATGRTKFARCLLLRMLDGNSLGITDHDRNLVIDLGDGFGDTTYYADTGILPSAVQLAVGLEADNFEVTGPITNRLTRAQILGGRLDMASAKLFDVRWDQLSDGYIPILKGYVTGANVSGGMFKFEVRSDSDRFNQVVGRILSPYCDNDFGDEKCAYYSVESDAVVVDVVTDLLTFTVTGFPGATPIDGYFNAGLAEFSSGPLLGTRSSQIFKWTAASKQVVLESPLPDLPVSGNTLTLFRGCGKTRQDCKDRNNILNFGGFPDVPGTDKTLRYPVPQ